MQDQFKRILELVRKTGDTMVVTDPNGKDVYVVMDLEHYESMVEAMIGDMDDSCADECCGGGCHDGRAENVDSFQEKPKNSQEEWKIPDEFIIDDPEGGLADEPETFPAMEEMDDSRSMGRQGIPSDTDIWTTMQSANDHGPTWNVSEMNDHEVAELERQYKEFAQKNVQQAILEEQVDGQNPKKTEPVDEFSEEQFYLEPIE